MLDSIALISVLISFLILGLAFTKKTEHFKVYALGVKNYPTPILIATMIATMVGGSMTLGNSAGVFEYGIWFLLALFSIPIGSIFTAYFILPKLTEYYGCVSVADIIGRMYGRKARLISGVLGSLYCFGAVAAQLIAIMLVLQHIWGSDSKAILIVASLIIILYTAIGGARSVVATDVLQFAIVLIFYPIVCALVIKFYGGFDNILAQLPPSKFEFNLSSALLFFGYGAFGILPDANPSFIQRLLMSKKVEQLRTVIYSLVLAEIPVIIAIGSIAIIGITQFPNAIPNEAFFLVAQKALPSFLYIILGIVLIAIIVSTADSLLNACAVLLVRDVVVQLKRLTDKDQVIWVRVLGSIIGLLSLFLALAQNNIINTIIFFGGIYIVAITIPLYLGLFFKAHNPNVFYYSTIPSSVLFVLLCFKYQEYEYIVFLICLFLNISIYISLALYYRNNSTELTSPSESFISRLQKLKLMTKLSHETLAILMLITFFSVIFRQYFLYKFNTGFIGESIGVIAFIVLFLSFIFDNSTKSIAIKTIIILLASWYTFSFVPFYLYYSYQQETIWLIQLILSMVLLGWLTPWPIYILQVVTGLIMATLLYSSFGEINVQAMIAASFTLCMYVTLILLGVFIFFRRYNTDSAAKPITDTIYKEKIAAQDTYHNVILNQQEMFELNAFELISLLKHYFILDTMAKSITLGVDTAFQSIKTATPVSELYKLIFSITYYLLKICEEGKNLDIDIKQENREIIINFQMYNTKILFTDIQKYINTLNPNPESGLLNWSQIKALSQSYDYKFIIKDNNITMRNTIKVISQIVYFRND